MNIIKTTFAIQYASQSKYIFKNRLADSQTGWHI